MEQTCAHALAVTAARARLLAMDMVHTAASGHIGGSLSVMDALVEQGAHNINLVNPTHFAAFLAQALTGYRPGVPVVYTGPVDRYFDYELGDLKWRTVDFKEVRYDEGDHFGCPVMNFSDADVPYTRAIEFKNFNPERHDSQNPNKTVVWEEYSRFAERGDEPYYPVNTDADKALYAQYEAKAKAEPNTVFGGRLGTYKYYDMHNVIDTALTAYEEQVAPLLKK